jgi:putative ubiquitin-RnfH superfamily antitoxin RatB of RatAB toxin-antitoxin module
MRHPSSGRRGLLESKAVKKQLQVEVAYALPERQALIALEVEEGTTALTAIERSGILQQFPQANPRRDGMGVFGKQVAPDTPLRDGDRVEIYRPLVADPKEARRKRAGKTPRRPRGR